MTKEQMVFLEQFMDDYQINKFHYLVRHNEIQNVLDFYETKENFKNIQKVEEEHRVLMELMESFTFTHSKPMIEAIEQKLRVKKNILNSINNFVEESVVGIKKEYQEKLKEVQNIYINNDLLLENNKNSEYEKKLNNFKLKNEKIIKGLYISIIILTGIKVFL